MRQKDFLYCDVRAVSHSCYVYLCNCEFGNVHLEDVNAVEHDGVHPAELLPEHEHQGDEEGSPVGAGGDFIIFPLCLSTCLGLRSFYLVSRSPRPAESWALSSRLLLIW